MNLREFIHRPDVVMNNPAITRPILEMKVENFGPVTNGNIALKPLTVFMGPNNSGKSYIALLIHSIFNCQHEYRLRISDLQHSIKKMQEEYDTNVKKQIITNEIALDTKQINDALEEELQRNFSAKLENLIKIGNDSCNLHIKSNLIQTNITIKKSKTTFSKNTPFKIPFKIDPQNTSNDEKYVIDQNTIIMPNVDVDTKRSLDSMYAAIRRYCRYLLPYTFYLPASRYGTLQSHKILAGGLLRNIPLAGIRDIVLPKLPGSVVDFLSEILKLSHIRKHNSKIADYMENSIIGGKIITKPDESTWSTEIEYIHQGKNMPLHRSSSAVSEITPLILYIRHYVKPGCLFIIEEPESHLDPRNQLLLAKCIVNLVREGVYVLITTHSPYIVEKIGNFLEMSAIPEQNRKNLQESDDDYIKKDEIAVYSFDMDYSKNNVEIKNVEMSTEDGIVQDLFVKSFEELNNESYKIENTK